MPRATSTRRKTASRTKKTKNAKSRENHKGIMTGVALGIFLLSLFMIDTFVADSEVTGNVVAPIEEEVIPTEEFPTAVITSPPAGSLQTGDFTVSVAVPNYAHDCYYVIRDEGSVKWDRRTKNCGEPVTIKSSWCQTSGTDTCSLQYNINYNDHVTKKVTVSFSRP